MAEKTEKRNIKEVLSGLTFANIEQSHFEEMERISENMTLEEAKIIIDTVLPIAKQLYLDVEWYKGQ